MNTSKSTFALSIACLFLLLAVFAPSAMAQSIGAIADRASGSIGGVTRLAESVAYMVGFLFGIGALVKFKAHRDNPQQTPISTPIVLLFVAVGLIALPAVLSSGQETLWANPETLTRPQ